MISKYDVAVNNSAIAAEIRNAGLNKLDMTKRFWLDVFDFANDNNLPVQDVCKALLRES